ncbi:hypothetical protein B5X24_HaOG216885 [Helicoverpa armigera]|uniref:Uncharacterized protein n=1 Tax=Helicoverpa armigera TaxID=29058 RepID=A0A2W1C1S4_HELAM|nr:hypothetical protein B5X24_HaOG216885 [Helicoverpa armigera]
MSIVVFCLGLLSLTGGVLAEIWEFGVDAPGSMVIDHREGDFSLFEKTKEIKLKVPRCYVMEYIRVAVHNPVSTPVVRYNKSLHIVSIAYKALQYSASSYMIIAKAARKPGCYKKIDLDLRYGEKHYL